ncbi:7SK snRNA methylphosphate capping enzyme-like [Mugil cephalus]|uniref:7SK snRNA methylphosphate capping enzyme-like n=1 Tax=Mugil cephalus TaxID=48193 RepID=UPI001FB61BBE|nr:7SK snRNA methylphosphate capping enzyme-like [Mugil cephalus]XP_047442581.1 7SK snRNA methylphosphate capping enzyme-like [Mugil cephalus]XP_047442591.1 7SK snRNA methylphosphate capping enzyme-like [Mugil cephalus]
MSLDKDAVLPHGCPVQLSQSEQPPLAKTRPLKRPLPTQPIAKRRYSMGVSLKGPAKRRRRANSDSQSEPVLPSHFLLGGNIFDPLNLNSLLDEDVNRATNQETPKCSPLPSRGGDPVEILVPRDITDPLNLKGGGAEGGGGVLLSPLKSRKRHRPRHHGGGGGGGGEKEVIPARLFPPATQLTGAAPLLATEGSVPASPLPCELNTAITCRDDLAPPPILPRRHTHPLPGPAHRPGSQGDNRHRRRRRTTSTKSTDVTVTTTTTAMPTKFQTPLVGGAKAGRCGGPQTSRAWPPQKKKKDKHRYQYGNHSRYYGYHGFYGDRWEGRVGVEEDARLRLLEADWFRDKTVLDVGCGPGHMTLALARRFNPTHILGVELDQRLVHAANQNIRHFLSHDLVVEERKGRGGTIAPSPPQHEQGEEGGGKEEVTEVMEQVMEDLLSFPLSFRVSRGPLSAPPLLLTSSSSSCRFPNNVTFIQGDYVSEEAWPGRGQYDVVMCLGVTKWVQLQSGDGGVARLFRRAYESLSPGGLLILEPQLWSSYSRSKRASEDTYRHFRTLRLRPELFTSFLTDSVGFTSYRLLRHSGNQRPIYLFHKGPAHRK